MSTATNDTAWKISESLGTVTTSNKSKTITISTAGTYVDKDIEITVSATKPSAASFTSGTTSVSSGVATMGAFTNTAGYASAGSPRLAAATFSNSATSGTTYVDISEAKLGSTSGSYVMPIIDSGGYLYINRGYVDNMKVSLAHLIPDDSTIEYNATTKISSQMLNGVTAYDKNGNLITGNIGNASVTLSDSELSVSPAVLPTPTASATNQAGVTLGTVATSAPSGKVSIKVVGGNSATTGSATSGESCTVTTTAGYIATGDTQTVTSTAIATATANSKTVYYPITGITVPKDCAFTVSTTADTALDTTSNLTLTNNAYRKTAITNNANGTVEVTNKGNTTVSSGSATTGNLSVNAYNGSTASGAKSIVSAGKWVTNTVTPSTTSQGPYYGCTTVNAMTAGSITAGTNTAPSVSIGHTATGILTTTTATNTYCIASSIQSAGTCGYTVTPGYISDNGSLTTAEPSVSGTGTIYFQETNTAVSATISRTTEGYSAPVTTTTLSSTVPQIKVEATADEQKVVPAGYTKGVKYINYFTGAYTVA